MKNVNIFLLILLFLLISCKASKEVSIDNFFKKWEQDSKKISDINSISKLENSVKEIVQNELCQNREIYVKRFPKLKYFVTQEKVKVSMSENLSVNSITLHKEKFVFVDSLIYNRINCNFLKPLILTDERKKKVLGKLKYGFGSSSYRINEDNARVLLDSHHSSKHFTLPYKIENITFNKSIDSAIVSSASLYDDYGKLYIKENESWKFRSEIWHLVE